MDRMTHLSTVHMNRVPVNQNVCQYAGDVMAGGPGERETQTHVHTLRAMSHC